MTRGFVTLTTGDIKYYKMAANMLASFRIHNPETRFAIICDRENEYTAKFDDVVILENANGDYRDKFSLLIKSPYDENFFIEPDCLIYKNIDFFWDLLAKESDFSSFGWNDGGLTRWFRTEEALNRIKEYVPKLETKLVDPLFNPGYMFIRKGEKCKIMYEDCCYIASKILADPLFENNGSMMCTGKLRDDPILAVAMMINNFICHAKPNKSKCISLPSKYTINKIDIIEGKLDVTDKAGKEFQDCALLHFSTRKALEEGLYLWQCCVIKLLLKKSWFAQVLNRRGFEKIFVIYRYLTTRIKSRLQKK